MCVSKINRSLLLFFVGLMLSFGGYAQEIKVRGTVVDDSGIPLKGVSIYDIDNQKKPAGITDEEGRFTVVVDRNTSLLFTDMRYAEVIVPVEGRLLIKQIVMRRSAFDLSEVSVIAQRQAAVEIEETDIELIGNYFHIKTSAKIPMELLRTNCRFIMQPDIYNVTRGELSYMCPKVVDGREYNITQERMYAFDLSHDPLYDYFLDAGLLQQYDDDTYIFYYHDSLYVDDVADNFRCDVMKTIENYNEVLSRDTVVIANGVVNPLRFLEYDFEEAVITDSAYFPRPDPQLYDTRGEVRLVFDIGRSTIDVSREENRREIERLSGELRRIEANIDAKLKEFSITGSASPDGNYDRNITLARRRTDRAMAVIAGNLPRTTLKNVAVRTHAFVVPWSDVVHLLRGDSLHDEAIAIQQIIDRYPENLSRQSSAIYRLSCYKTVLVPRYLPHLRRVRYQYSYEMFRLLTDEEILQQYERDSSLSRYDFWRLYNMQSDPAEREAICRRGLALHANFMMAANDLAVMCIARGCPDSRILAPYILREDIPDAVKINQAIAWLHEREYAQADSILTSLDDAEANSRLIAVAHVLSGRYRSSPRSVEIVAAMCPVNSVLMLLLQKKNKEAYAQAVRTLGETPKELYIKAMATQRLVEDDLHKIDEAVSYLRKAIALDPSLKTVAQTDADVLDLLPLAYPEDHQ